MSTAAHAILRPAKRRKKENGEPPFFLDFFPKEVLANVLRYMSSLPNAKNWEMHLDLRNLVELMAVHGGSFMESRFKTLCVSTTNDGKPESDKYGWNKRDGYHLWTNSLAVARKYILAGGGESLETLVVGDRMFNMNRDGEGLINDFVEHCPNVTSLSIVEGGSSWVNAFGKQLVKLELRTAFPIDFPVYCTKLRELTLNPCGGGSIPAEFWRRIGSGLEILNVRDFSLSENEIGDIKQHCQNLKNISLVGGASREKAAIANLLASYGGQLEYALLCEMDEVHLKEVADACPKARFHLNTSYMDVLFSGLNMLGPRLESITNNLGTQIAGDIDGWKNAWAKATTLRKLDIQIMRVGYAEAVFSTPKEHLKELQVWLSANREDDVKKVMDVCTKGTKCLETFSYLGILFFRDSSKTFFQQNKDSLSSISIFPAPRAGDKKLDELLNSFLEMPALEILCLESKIPDAILSALEKRGVYWKNAVHPYVI